MQEAEMKPYTNTIPGTRVTYVMLPIPGGEFMEGSGVELLLVRERGLGRQPDEAPISTAS
jgi:hypothetical protein